MKKHMNLIIKNARLIDPYNNKDEILDIIVKEGKIFDIGKFDQINSDFLKIDATDKIAVPGLIDMHVHLRDPGYEYKEDIESGSEAASQGGFTSIACMPNTCPVNDNASVTENIIKKGKEGGFTDIYPIGSCTKGQLGKAISEIYDLKCAGAVAISDDGRPVISSLLMRRVMEYASMFDLAVISHCEDPELSKGGVMNEGFVSTELGLAGIPNAVEDIMVARDIELARLTKSKLHIAHISTAESVKMIRKAKEDGIRITCEVTPHHFTLTDEAVRGYDTNTKMNPPLRTQNDIDEIKIGLKDGTIDVIATDHAPHEQSEKMVEYNYAPFGISGLETAVPLSLALYHEKLLPLNDLIKKLTISPAKILGIKKGTLSIGEQADITILDIDNTKVIDSKNFKSKGKNTPFNGYRLKGSVSKTIFNGKVVFDGTGE